MNTRIFLLFTSSSRTKSKRSRKKEILIKPFIRSLGRQHPEFALPASRPETTPSPSQQPAQPPIKVAPRRGRGRGRGRVRRTEQSPPAVGQLASAEEKRDNTRSIASYSSSVASFVPAETLSDGISRDGAVPSKRSDDGAAQDDAAYDDAAHDDAVDDGGSVANDPFGLGVINRG